MARVLLLALLLSACSDDDSPSGPDGGGDTADAPTGGPDAPTGAIDAPSGAQPDSATLGDLCVTTSTDGGAGSCSGEEVCCTNATPYICRLPSDCPGGVGYVPCNQGSDCQGRVCCQLPAMTFCTKEDACKDYGGTIIP